jgi:AcrR family transcriptional regulator
VGSETGRRYAGQSAQQRQAERRVRLRDACLQVVGTQGWAGTTVQGVCTSAGVTTRTFYEEHGSLVALLADTYAELLVAARGAVSEALISDGDPLAAYVRWMTDDPRRARVAHREVRVAGVLDDQRRAGVVDFAQLVAAQARVTPLVALALTGAVNELVVDWVAVGGPVAPRIEALHTVFSAVLDRLLTGDRPS